VALLFSIFFFDLISLAHDPCGANKKN